MLWISLPADSRSLKATLLITYYLLQGAKAGIAVGVVVAALLLIGGGAFFFVKKRKAAKQAASNAHLPNYNDVHGVPTNTTPAQVAAMGEKPRV